MRTASVTTKFDSFSRPLNHFPKPWFGIDPLVCHNAGEKSHPMPDRENLARIAVLDALSLGQSVTAAARLAGVHRSTIYHWNRTDAEVARALALSRAGCHSSIYDEVQDLADRALSTIRETIDNPDLSPSLRLRAALAILKSASAPAPAPPPTEFDTSVESVSPQPVSNATYRREGPKTGRNEPCPCGSGRKYKLCCLNDSQLPKAFLGLSHISRDTQPGSS